jgi:hypothetical protein
VGSVPQVIGVPTLYHGIAMPSTSTASHHAGERVVAPYGRLMWLVGEHPAGGGGRPASGGWSAAAMMGDLVVERAGELTDQ